MEERLLLEIDKQNANTEEIILQLKNVGFDQDPNYPPVEVGNSLLIRGKIDKSKKQVLSSINGFKAIWQDAKIQAFNEGLDFETRKEMVRTYLAENDPSPLIESIWSEESRLFRGGISYETIEVLEAYFVQRMSLREIAQKLRRSTQGVRQLLREGIGSLAKYRYFRLLASELEVDVPPTEEWDIEDLNLPVRCENGLKSMGVDKVGDLVNYSERDFAKVPGVGLTTRHALEEVIFSLVQEKLLERDIIDKWLFGSR